ncbi:heat shock protein [Entamoeba histolytica HM-3:IMSS]|uniref:Uncharacterized protein n=4 Tax=Entamoeba histolytica TaxID=5759 RepID=C4M2J7_ENTH1|nr:hypothetical protein EHI_054780 [Entamoeba histolytica HM-1:IMSS]EAL46689.2 hypothetical protein EHI_054780 [Entamoeba histolytica HM-1:IMSS]EMD47243.1 heat shock protein, putative [Entamoeba histolytica KU27]EMS16690.1 heat shock protein [Entamoeba histolytica HM-3:IMSS]GAT95502.1 hypothetical protein CL6EHI_054780 [Entamoeba histolytica]|eukprot:XP_652075.2 hypothetical protein EHI_054780 [Entamoeba histolytica HM-1:IMSS]
MCLVFGLGGMLDTTILEKQGNGFNFKAIGSDVYFGGLYFNMNLMEFGMSKLKAINKTKAQRRIFKGSDCWIQRNIKKQLKYNLRKEVEKTKIELSINLYCELDISELLPKSNLYKIDDNVDYGYDYRSE